MYAINYYATAKWAGLGAGSRLYDVTDAQVSYRLDRLFYSPDHQRAIVWVSEKCPNARTLTVYNKEHPAWNRMCPTSGDTVVSLLAFVGLRESNKLWKLYSLDMIIVQCARSADEARPYLEQYYFKRMKNDSAPLSKTLINSAYGGGIDQNYLKQREKSGYPVDADSPLLIVKYGYNLQDVDFWTKHLLWQKGALLPGLYLFETKPGAQPGYKDAPLVPPSVPYPEEITRLF